MTTTPVDGVEMIGWARDLWPLCRSLTGDGVRETLGYLGRLLPDLEVIEVPSGTQALDWIVPDEWTIREAWIEDLDGRRIIDFRDNNLHVVGYSVPFEGVLGRDALEPHLHSLPDQPDAIPYVTSYYARRWGFCLSQRARDALGEGPFRVLIDSSLEPGSLTYGELVIPGRTADEVLLSTYVCHPSMANNELSGPVVTTALARGIAGRAKRRYTYRVLFLPETIGSITYLSTHLEQLRERVKAGWVITCVGDDRAYSYVPSRLGGTLADRISLQVMGELTDGFDAYSYLDRGSDERQWCSPGADLPVCSVMRSKYGTYPEYHTSLDDFTVVTPQGLQGGFDVLERCIDVLESNVSYRATMPGEPQLGRRGLYPTTSFKGSADGVKTMMDVLAYCDGTHDLIDLCQRTGATLTEVMELVATLSQAGVIVEEAEGA